MIKKLILLLGLVCNLKGATYYVATNGNNGNPGTSGSPWLTIQKGSDTAVAGDTVLVGPGVYAENVRTANNAGTAANPIIFDGQNVATVGSWSLENPYIKILNFTVKGGTNLWNGLLYVERVGSCCVVSNNIFDGELKTALSPIVRWNGPDAAPFGVAGSSNFFLNNQFKNARAEMVFRVFGDTNTFYGNFAYNCDATDFMQGFGRNIRLISNTVSNFYDSGLTANHVDFFQTFPVGGPGGFGSKNHLIESNYVNGMHVLAQLGNLTDDEDPTNVCNMTWRNNVFVGVSAKLSGAMPGLEFYNNTFVRCSTNEVNGGNVLILASTTVGDGHSARIYNNTFIDCGLPGVNTAGWYSIDPALTNTSANYNYVSKGNYGTVTGFSEANGINGGNPYFFNQEQLDFRLMPNSPLIGVGSPIASFTNDIRGITRSSAWEIGPYEYSITDFSTYPCYIEPRLIKAYSVANSNATTIILPINTNRLEVAIGRRLSTNRPSAYTVYTNLYTLNSAAVTNVISFTDTNFAGVNYEYEIKQTIRTNIICNDINGYIDYQYLEAGYRVPLKDTRGNIILLVESGKAAALATEITRLTNDFVGDGWKVFRHDITASEATAGTTWTNAVWNTKQLINTDYNTDSSTIWAVFILGHVPVPYSGEHSPGAHDDNVGAHAADLFYADLDGTYTDTTVNNSTAGATFTHNVPGDGKFDQTYLPSAPELRIGRVDLGNMPAFALSETELLRQYLNRNHSWRHKGFTVREKGLIYTDSQTNLLNAGKPLESHNVFSSYFGNTTSIDMGNWLALSITTNNSYLFAAKQGSGHIDEDVQLGTTANFAATNFYAVFVSSYGSYYGSWDSLNTNVFLKAPLAGAGYTISTWYHENPMQVSSSSMDEPIGQEEFAKQSGRFYIGSGKEYVDYYSIVPFVATNLVISQHKMNESLMGDPTLRTHVVAPPSGLSVTPSGSDNSVTWTASTDINIQGYHVYRATTGSLNNFTRLTSSPTTSPYTDTGAAGGSYTYMVRAVKLEDLTQGSFYNASQGIFAEASGGGGPVIPPGTVIRSATTFRSNTTIR